MHLIVECSNCGASVRPELGVATANAFQHRECADRFGVGTQGQRLALPIDQAIPHRHHADTVHKAPAATPAYAELSAS
jgi:hypothetical protein